MRQTAASDDRAGRIGPNAVIQLRAAMIEVLGEGQARAFFSRCGLGELYSDPPTEMIEEAIPARLYQRLYADLPVEEADSIARRSGVLTADYVMANRIPGLVRTLLQVLPPALSGPILLKAIQKNAWTFAGTGKCSVASGARARIRISGNPLSMPGGTWHDGVFTRMFRRLVCASAAVSWRAGNGAGRDDRFLIRYGRDGLAAPCGRKSLLCIGCVQDAEDRN